jgi:AraC-like DNA-binding protein
VKAQSDWAGGIPHVVVHTKRERPRALLRAAFPRRKGKLAFTKAAGELLDILRGAVVDAVVVDVSGSPEDVWRISALSSEFPSTPFFGLTSLRAGDAQATSDCASREFAGILVEGVDDPVIRDLLWRASFSARFARALADPPRILGLTTDLQRRVWEVVVSHAGRPVRTMSLAPAVGVTREHLSRSFSSNGAPNLKRTIDLVRIVAAAELAKSPGLDLKDVAKVLGFASASHLSTTSVRIAGTKPVSLTRLRAVDIFERFVKGHGRSRA